MQIPTSTLRKASRAIRTRQSPSSPRTNMPNPAGVYAEEQGLTVETREDAQGNQYGVITLPSGQEVNQWDYYRENYVRPAPTPGIIPSKINIIKKKILPPRPGPLRRTQSSPQPSRRLGGTPTMADRKIATLKKINYKKSPSTKPQEKVIDIKKLMGEEKRSMFFS